MALGAFRVFVKGVEHTHIRGTPAAPLTPIASKEPLQIVGAAPGRLFEKTGMAHKIDASPAHAGFTGVEIMTDNVRTFGYGGVAQSAEQRNKVLRNTYWLLALSLLPTVAGAWLGVATGITQALTGGLGLVVFLGGAFGFMYAIEKTKDSAAGVPVLLGFTFFMGLMLSRMIGMILGFSNGSQLIMTAMGGTAGVFFVMATLASVIKRDISGMGKWLFVGALVVMVGSIVNIFVGSTAGMMAISVAVIGIFSAYMLYDLKQILDGGETNYISATLRLYLDIFNVFQALLALLGIMGGERE
jgi:modulator of FtsH protease